MSLTSKPPRKPVLPPEKQSPPERTPDGRYIIVRERLWRAANPQLPVDVRDGHVRELMDARREVGRAKRSNDLAAEKAARARVHEAKTELGERGPVWWSDGAPDENRKLVKNSSYADWWAARDRG